MEIGNHFDDDSGNRISNERFIFREFDTKVHSNCVFIEFSRRKHRAHHPHRLANVGAIFQHFLTKPYSLIRYINLEAVHNLLTRFS